MMTKKTLTAALIIVACATVAVFALPTIKITTANGSDPPDGTLVTGGNPPAATNSSPAYDFNYVSMSKFELTGTGSEHLDVTRNVSADSVRQRGNSTANVDMPKKPYRIKFDQKVSLFGKPAAKSWVLLANHMDKTFAMNALAFRLGEIIGLEFTPSFQFVNLEINGQYKGIYQLTEQVQVNKGRVDIDEDKGWLVEFNFHNADANDIMFTSGGSRYNLSVFIKSPEIDDNAYINSNVSSYPQLAFVRDEFNKIMDTLADNTKFQAGAHRDYIDLSSYAKYVFVQQFMANFEWAQLGYVGSNFAYKNVGDRMKAGPLWDFDLATGTLGGGTTTYTFFSSSSSSMSILPPRTSMMGSVRNTFYQRLIGDEVFRARYRKVWDDNKVKIQALAATGGFIDSIAGVLKDHIEANWEPYKDFTAPAPNSTGCFVGCGVVGSGAQTVEAYDAEITKLKTWWNNRYNHWDNQIKGSVNYGSGNNYTFDDTKDIPDPTQYTVKVGRTPNVGGTVSLKIGNETTIVNPDGNHYVTEGTSVRIGSAVNSSYRFTGWTAVNGTSLPENIDPLRDTITFTISGNIDVKANYETESSINAARGIFANGSRVTAARDGLRLNVVDKATVKIYGLDGKQVRRVDLTSGSHHLRMNDLPKGLYMARVSMDGQVRTLRVPIR